MTIHALYTNAADTSQSHFAQVASVCQRCNLPIPTQIETDCDALPGTLKKSDTQDFYIAFVGPETQQPFETAKRLRGVIADIHFIFLVSQANRPLLRSLQSPVSGLGNHWDMLDPTSNQFEDNLIKCLKATIKKSRFRTTLSKLNRKLQQNHKPKVSELQRFSTSLDYLAHIVEHAHDGIIATTLDGVIVKWNLATAEILGLGSEQAVGLSIFSTPNQEWGKQLHPIYKEFISSPKRFSEHEIAFKSVSNQQQVLALTLSRILDKSDQAIGIATFIRNITERKLTEKVLEDVRKDLERMSFEDGLTAVANRRMFDNRLNQEWGRMQRNHLPLSIILIDVDYFKHYNDFYGHQAGDECLRKVARALQHQAARSSDIVARYGGEEFVILLPETSADNAYQIALNCATAIRELDLPHEKSSVAEHVTISGGVMSILPGNDNSPEQFLRGVDQLLYRAKEKGRNQIQKA